jgi:hypothetical protein
LFVTKRSHRFEYKKMSACLNVSAAIQAPLCGGKGTACVFSTSPVLLFNCTCIDGWTGFGEYNSAPDNCDIFKPAIYTLGSIVLIADFLILWVAYWAISQRGVKGFLVLLLRKRNAAAMITVSGILVAFLQIIWESLRLSDLDRRAIAVDDATTIAFGLAIVFIYITAPHVLRHYAKLTFSEHRIRMLNTVGREKAKLRAKLARPLVRIILPLFSATAGFGNFASLGDPSRAKVALKIMSASTAVFLVFTLVLIRILITPMVRDMRLVVSMNRFDATEQEMLVTATRKVVFFQYLIVIVSTTYIPLILICGFVPELRGAVTYIWHFGAFFCAAISGFSIYTLTNVVQSNRFSLFRKPKSTPIANKPLLIEPGLESSSQKMVSKGNLAEEAGDPQANEREKVIEPQV